MRPASSQDDCWCQAVLSIGPAFHRPGSPCSPSELRVVSAMRAASRGARPDLIIIAEAVTHRGWFRAYLRRCGIGRTTWRRTSRSSTASRRGGRSTGFDRATYCCRKTVERCFGQLGRLLGIASRYEKTATSDEAAVVLAAMPIQARSFRGRGLVRRGPWMPGRASTAICDYTASSCWAAAGAGRSWPDLFFTSSTFSTNSWKSSWLAPSSRPFLPLLPCAMPRL
ncbi:hypothetical protein B6R96_00150 [Streptomyces sp. Sge12]|nr:hypothetical protein B6R96_00150 [Streptomyces sp. Sge12]